MPGILCEHCTAVCCRYIALPIETPDSHSDFEDIRWYLLHEGVSVFVEDGDWYISITTTCRHLQPDHRCGIYHTRPRICRTYSTDNCDYHSGDYGWSAHFTCPEHLDLYLRKARGERKEGVKRNGRRRPQGARGVNVKLRNRVAAQRSMRVQAAQRLEPLILRDHDVRGVPLPVLPLAAAPSQNGG